MVFKKWLVAGLFLLCGYGIADEILLVGSGGWKSCKNGIRFQFIGRQLDNLAKDLRKTFPHARISILRTCADFKAAKWGVPINFLYEGARGAVTGSVTPEGFGDLVSRYRVAENDKVFLIGHSHGGWHSMIAASRLRHVSGLFTLEPVSAAGCDVVDYLHNRSKRVLKFRQRVVAGCRQAPTDLDTASIATNTGGQWHNYVLSRGEYKGDIHSSLISFAKNWEIAVNQGDRSHHYLGLSSSGWRDICHKISALLGVDENNPHCTAMQVDGEGQFVRFH